MTTDLVPSWEHPGLHNSANEGRFGNGSESHKDQSLGGLKKRSSTGSSPTGRLKDPPMNSDFSGRQQGHRRMKSEGAALSLKPPPPGEVPRKIPPDPGYTRKGRTKKAPGTSFVFDAIPMRRASLKDDPAKETGGDSTTCEETRSVSDNSSSLQSPENQSAGSSRSIGENLLGDIPHMSGSSKRNPMPDTSAASYSARSSKSARMPRESTNKDPPIPMAVEQFDERSMGGPYGGSRREHQDYDHHGRRRHYDDQPPPLAPYDDGSVRSSRYEDDYYGRPPPGQSGRYHHRHDEERSVRMHDRFDDDNMSRASRASRYHHHDDRSHYDGGRSYQRHHPPRHHHHDQFDDDNMSRVSRASRYHDNRSVAGRFDDDAASRCSRPSRYPGELDGGGSRHSRVSYREDMSVSHPSRYEMDRATGYHYNGRDRYYEDERSGLYYQHQRHHHHRHHHHPPSHHHRGGYDDEQSMCEERSHYHDRDRDDASTIVSSYSRYDRPSSNLHDSYVSREGPYGRSNRRYDHDDHYHRDGRREDSYGRSDPRDDDYSHHSEFNRRGGGYPEEKPEDDYGERRPGAVRSSNRDDLYAAKMRALGMPEDTVKEKPVQQSKEGEVFIEIGFGTKARLRRTKETMDAIARDFYAPAACFACSSDLFCIADVEYIVCPQCKTISPAEQAAAAGEGGKAVSFDGQPMHRHGVGLGFTYDTLFRMQSEVMQKRGEARAARAKTVY